jgi:hypothetical protein
MDHAQLSPLTLAIVEAAKLRYLHDGNYRYSSLIPVLNMHTSRSIPVGETRQQVSLSSPSFNQCLEYYLQGKDDVCSSGSESVSRLLSRSLNYKRPTMELDRDLYRLILLGQPEFEYIER